MNAEQLLAHFDRISDAPDAVSRLRKLIHKLAVRGTLVARNLGDESVLELVKAIATAKAKEKSSSRANKEVVTLVAAEAAPVEIPDHWVWLKLTDLGSLSGGMTPSKNRPEFWDGDVNWFSPKDIKSDELFDSELKISKAGLMGTNLQLYPIGCLFMVARSGILKRTFPVAINRVEAAVNQDLKVLNPFVKGMERYLQIMFYGLSDFILSKLVKTGTTVQSLKYEEFEAQAFPLPPLSEQSRIIGKVDELMTLCDRLEAAQRERESRQDQFTASTHHHLNNGADAEVIRIHAQFFINHLPRLTARPEQIQHLRQTILNLAVRGRLTTQDSNAEDASLLLEKIERNRARLLRERKIPKPHAVPVLQHCDPPFAISSNWKWARLGTLCYQVSDGPHFSPQYVSKGEGVPFFSTRNVKVNRFDLTDVKYVSKEDHRRFCERLRPEVGDILYTKGGTTGIARVNDLDFEFSVWVHIAVLKVAKESIEPRFIALSLNSPFCYEQSQHYTQGTSNFDLGLTRMIKILLPLPPLEEQLRIVAKVDELMAFCDRLDATLAMSQTKAGHLLESVLHHVLDPAAREELVQAVP